MVHKATVGVLSAIGIAVIVDVLLCFRYAAWGCSLAELFPFLGFTILAEVLIIYSISEFKQIINPFLLYAVFIYIAGFSFLPVSERQEPYSLLFMGILVGSIVSFIAGGMTALKTNKFSFQSVIPELSARMSFFFLLSLLAMGILVFVIEIRQLGYLPVLNLGNAAVYDDLNHNEVTPLHNFIVLNSILPAMFYITNKRGLIPFWVFLLLSLVSSFIILNFFSRQIIVLFFFSMLVAVSYYKNISVSKLLSIGSVCIVLFILLGQLRGSSEDQTSAGSINDFLKLYAGITKPTNILETYLTLYGGLNFTTGSTITHAAVHDGYISYGAYAMRPIIGALPVNTEKIYPEVYSSYSLLGTYMVDPFLDFRWLGVVGLNFLYGFLSVNSFKNYLSKKSPYYIIEWSLFVFCIFMCSFTNYFNLFFVVFFFIINRLAIK
jgi:oligosaccharide repeat unit polymerase